MKVYVVNPTTGKKIKVGGPTFNDLPKVTRDKLLRGPPRSSSSRSETPKKKTKSTTLAQSQEKDIEVLKKLTTRCF
jgi:hypothetical protein